MKPAAVPGEFVHLIVDTKTAAGRERRSWRTHQSDVAALYGRQGCRTWHPDALRDLLRQNFGAELAATYDMLPCPHGRSALASWCLLYQFGGLFLDHRLRLFTQLKVPEGRGVAAFNDVSPGASGWTGIDPAILWSQPQRSEWTTAIDIRIAERTGSRPALPDAVVLGYAFGAAARERGERHVDDQWIGQLRSVPRSATTNEQAFVTPEGSIVAFRAATATGTPREDVLGGAGRHA